jgi:microcystin-dependent protein
MAVLEANRVADSGGATLTVPPGTLIFHCANSAPSGFLKANGAALNTTTYAALFAAIGYTFGGSGASFNVPDMRGEFPRGWDDARGVDSGRVFGAFQGGFLPSHTHTMAHTHTGGVHNHRLPFGWDAGSYYAWLDANANPVFGSQVITGASRFRFGTLDFNINQNIRVAGSDNAGNVATSGASNSTTSAPSVGDTDLARPRNLALLACIKF